MRGKVRHLGLMGFIGSDEVGLNSAAVEVRSGAHFGHSRRDLREQQFAKAGQQRPPIEARAK